MALALERTSPITPTSCADFDSYEIPSSEKAGPLEMGSRI